MAATSEAVWVTNRIGDTVSRIDPATNEVTATATVGDGPNGVAATDTAVWVTNYDNTVSWIDPATNEVTATVPVGEQPQALAATEAAVWVANTGDGTVTRIDPRTG